MSIPSRAVQGQSGVPRRETDPACRTSRKLLSLTVLIVAAESHKICTEPVSLFWKGHAGRGDFFYLFVVPGEEGGHLLGEVLCGLFRALPCRAKDKHCTTEM